MHAKCTIRNSCERQASDIETDIRHNCINPCDAALVPSQFNCHAVTHSPVPRTLFTRKLKIPFKYMISAYYASFNLAQRLDLLHLASDDCPIHVHNTGNLFSKIDVWILVFSKKCIRIYMGAKYDDSRFKIISHFDFYINKERFRKIEKKKIKVFDIFFNF